MKTEIFNFNDIDADGYSTQNLVQVTGLDFDYPSILDHIKMLKRKYKDASADELVMKTCLWLEGKGNKCKFVTFCEVKF